MLTCYEKLFPSFNCAMLQTVLCCFDSCYDCFSTVVMTFHLVCAFKSFQVSPNTVNVVPALMCATKLMSVSKAITNAIILLLRYFFHHSVYDSIIAVCHTVLCKFHTALDVVHLYLLVPFFHWNEHLQYFIDAENNNNENVSYCELRRSLQQQKKP